MIVAAMSLTGVRMWCLMCARGGGAPNLARGGIPAIWALDDPRAWMRVCDWLRTARNPAAPAYAIGEYGRWMTPGVG